MDDEFELKPYLVRARYNGKNHLPLVCFGADLVDAGCEARRMVAPDEMLEEDVLILSVSPIDPASWAALVAAAESPPTAAAPPARGRAARPRLRVAKGTRTG